MKLVLALSVGALVALICCGDAHSRVVDPNYDLLESFADEQPGRVVVVGTVRSVKNVDLLVHGTITKTYPEILVDVEATYRGDQQATITVIGFNTFHILGGQWMESSIMGAPWPLPGDRVLILAQQGSVVDKNGIESAMLRLRSALFIVDRDPLETNTLYEYRGISGPDTETLRSPSATLVELLLSMEREAVPSGYSLDDVVNAIREAADDE